MNKNLHNSVLYIDMGQLRRNAEAILRELDGAQLIPVLKGNAYGLGLEKVGAALADIPEIRTMAVAQVSEGAVLRQAGVTQDILVLGGVPERLLAPAVELGLTLTVGRPGLLPLLAELGRTQGRLVQVQVKVETGLHRYGLTPGAELDGLLEEWREYAPWIRVTGAFTHFADLGDPVRTEEQFQTYLRGVAQLERGGMEIPMRHVSASAASEYAPQYRLDGVPAAVYGPSHRPAGDGPGGVLLAGLGDPGAPPSGGGRPGLWRTHPDAPGWHGCHHLGGLWRRPGPGAGPGGRAGAHRRPAGAPAGLLHGPDGGGRHRDPLCGG